MGIKTPINMPPFLIIIFILLTSTIYNVEGVVHITNRRWTLPQDCPVTETQYPVKSTLCPPNTNPFGPRMICCGTIHVFPAPICGPGQPV